MKKTIQFTQRVLAVSMILLSAIAMQAQVRVPFTQRTSAFTPTQTIYSINGDFTMVGNTNMTLQNYSNSGLNSNQNMIKVDTDGISTTNNSSSSTLTFSNENGANPACSEILFAGLYWTARTDGTPTEAQKRAIKFRGPGESAYTTFNASSGNIRYPGDDNMYVGFVEVTEKVRDRGVGEYWVADMALTTGNGGSAGYYGGWGMVVIYQNALMQKRDVTIFDGYAYVVGGTAQWEVPVSGFNSALAGAVTTKLGMMAGEGDVTITGDKFEIQKLNTSNYELLNHGGNTNSNFYNSTIFTGGNARNPNLANNTGMDISMFTIPNPSNSVIGNGQSSTKFRYSSTGDTYIIYSICMAVDAYEPEIEGFLSTLSVNGTPATSSDLTVVPGDQIQYKVQIRNKGNEPVNNVRVEIPLPYAAVTYQGSTSTAFAPASTSATPYVNSTLGANGTLIWDFGTLPVPANPNQVLGEIIFTLQVSEDCELYRNFNCSAPQVDIDGNISGVGANTNITVNDQPFYVGFSEADGCSTVPVTGPFEIEINSTAWVAANCPAGDGVRDFSYCNRTTPISITEVLGFYPAGTRFFNTAGTVEYTTTNPFPSVVGPTSYKAQLPGGGCQLTFTIAVTTITSVPAVATDTLEYCQNAPAAVLNATPSNPSYTLYYYAPGNTAAQPSIIPSTSSAGSFTYQVAEGPSSTCISTNRANISVTILGLPNITATPQQPACFGQTGSVVLESSGGTGALTYSAINPATSGLTAGSYTYSVSDTKNCRSDATAAINAAPAQPAQPSIDCWETATWNSTTCQWVVTGEQDARPSTECWETATFNNTSCEWVVTGEQDARPATECWETATFNNTSCEWVVTGEQDARPSTECWQTATFNNTSCEWVVTGEQDARPNTECWETATFNNESCEWVVTGEQDARPSTECWETATFNNATCEWVVTGEQDARPTTECWQTATFNNETCEWVVTGEQDARPTTECWQTATFNNETCEWVVTGEQDARPTTECWQTATFNNTSCEWVVTGEQDARPSTECWQTATFNNATCEWVVTGEQDARPSTECWQTATFNNETCEWELISTLNNDILPSNLQNGLVAYWPFNGNANDAVNNNYNANVLGCTLSTDRNGIPASAYDFSGNGQYMTTPVIPALSGAANATFSCWVKVDGENTNTNCALGCSQFLIARDPDFSSQGFYLAYGQGNQKFGGAVSNAFGVLSSQTFSNPFNDWVHITWSIGGGSIMIYVNGQLSSSSNYNGILPASNSGLYFGFNPVGGFPYYLNGKMDDIAIWNRVLLSDEIEQLYNHNGTTLDAPQVACYETAIFNTNTCSWDINGTQPEPPITACYQNAIFNNATCEWVVTGEQDARPTTECWQTATFNNTSCEWVVTGEQDARPSTECWQTATFNNESCEWVVTGEQDARPSTECWQTATFNNTSCEWVVTGEQDARPSTECWQTATFNNETCEWVVTGEQDARPNTECWQTATFNNESCEWVVTGEQDARPATECWETATFNNETCEWVVTGEQEARPSTECWQTATFNNESCEWVVTGEQEARPNTECWETATFNNESCEWVVTGEQDARPTTECWETATFNNATCEWVVTGEQDARPATECWETATFNNATCEWVVTGEQDARPNTECWQSATFNNTSCEWVVTGEQDARPNTECWQTATFNNESCEWVVTGEQDARPATECWETATFNNETCEWVVTGEQDARPATECWETATFNNTSCEWVVTGEQDARPATECWETATFNNESCEWVVTGEQDARPTTECWETATFNNESCEWVVTGEQDARPTTECWETATFNNESCEWVVTGTQEPQPTGLACWESATFNTTSCDWDVTGTQPSAIVTNASVCGSYTWAANSQEYTSSGTYSYSLNCQDYSLNLTVTPAVNDTLVVSACDNYNWNGNVYTQSGTYTLSANCDNDCSAVQTSPFSCNGAGYTSTVSNNSDVNVGPGQIVRISTASFNKNLTISGGTLVICGVATPQNINMNTNGAEFTLIVNGSLILNNLNLPTNAVIKNYGSLTLNNSVGFSGEIQNYGSMTCSADFNVNSGGKFYNYATASVNNHNNSNISENRGTLAIGNRLQNNGGASFKNTCTLNIGNEFINNSSVVNEGSVAVQQMLRLNGGSTFDNAAGKTVSTKNLILDGTFRGVGSGLSRLSVSMSSLINSSGRLEGTTSLCDANGIETNNGQAIAPAFIGCSGSVSAASCCNTSTLVLTIAPSTSNTTTESACESYTWAANGTTYYSSGVYSKITGCNTEILNLTITPKPSQPSIACWEIATFNSGTCSWDVTGAQPAQPELACYEVANFNNATCEWDITVSDTTIPTILAPGADATIECPATPQFTAPTAEDACGEVSVVEVSDITTEGACPGTYSRTITWKAIDEYGNESAPVSQTITVTDSEAPVVVSRTNDFSTECGNLVSTCDLLCNADFEDNQIVNPGDWTYIDQSAVPCWLAIGSGNIIEVWGSGFSGVPSFSGLQFIELNSVSPSTVYQNFTAIPGATVDISFAHRGRAGVDVMSLEIGPVNGPYTTLGTFSAGTSQWNVNTVPYTFPNNANTNYALRFNAVSTAGGPSVGNFIDDVTMCISGGSNTQVIPPVFADNCSSDLSVDSTLVITVSDCNVLETYTWTATDLCGNSTSASTVITTMDTTPPVVDSYSMEITVYCDQSDAIPAPTASDVCSQVTMEYTDVLYSGGCPGTIERTYTFTDQCGNTANATQFITVIDNVPPMFTFVPEPRSFDCGVVYTAPVSAQAMDLCDADVQINYSSTIAPGDCPQQQLVINTWTAIDECQNQTSIQVTDVMTICPEVLEVTACQSYNWFDTDYTVSGIYEHVEHINGCDIVYVIDLTITPQITPAFSAVGPFCSGAVIPALPTVSTNGIQGTWSSAINNTATTNYTFTPNAGQCATGASLTIDINQPVTPTFSAVGPFCSGAVIPALPTTSVNGIQGQWSPAINNLATTNYTFTPNAGQCATTSARTITIKQPSSAQVSASACSSYPWNGQTYYSSGNYNYVTTNSVGCDSTVTLALTINTPSISATTITANPGFTISLGNSVTLSVNGGVLGTGAVWKWYRGSCGGTFVGSGSSITVSPTTTTTYFVRAEGLCNNTSCVSSTVVVNQLCGPQSLSSNAANNTVCYGSAVTLTVGGTLQSGGSWKWYKNSCGGVCIGTGTNLTVTPLSTTTYYVRSQGGTCGTTSCMAITVSVNAIPARPSSITGLTSGLCNRTGVTYCTPAVSGASSYQWSVPTGATITSGQGTTCITVNFSGSLGNNSTCGYAAICVRAVNSCGLSQSRCISLSTAPTGIATISGLSTLNQGVTTTYSVNSISGATSYAWTVPTGWTIQSGQGTTSITVITGANSGNVSVTPSNACSAGTRVRRYVTVCNSGYRNLEMPKMETTAVLLYPNPANDIFTIESGDLIPSMVEVLDISGKVVYYGNDVQQVNTQEFTTGIYLVRIYFKDEILTKRLEIVH
jgi:uncharacterized repeat protein (TIGR01451 family)